MRRSSFDSEQSRVVAEWIKGNPEDADLWHERAACLSYLLGPERARESLAAELRQDHAKTLKRIEFVFGGLGMRMLRRSFESVDWIEVAAEVIDWSERREGDDEDPSE